MQRITTREIYFRNIVPSEVENTPFYLIEELILLRP